MKASGGDYTSLLLAVGFFRNKIVLSTPQIQVDAGDYSAQGGIDIHDIITGAANFLDIIGDTREIASLAFVQGDTYTGGVSSAKAGVGSVNLSNSGNDITITRATTNPTLTDIVNGDKILIVDDSGVVTTPTVSSATETVITLATTAPTVGGYGSSVLILPNRKIGTINFSNPGGMVRLKGFWIVDISESYSGLVTSAYQGGTLLLEKCAIQFTTSPSFYNSHISSNNVNLALFATSGEPAILAFRKALFDFNYAFCLKTTPLAQEKGVVYVKNFATIGLGTFTANKGGHIELEVGTYRKGTPVSGMQAADTGSSGYINNVSFLGPTEGGTSEIAINANEGGQILIKNTTIKDWATGLYASNGSNIVSRTMTFTNVTTAKSPASSGSLGNNGSMVIEV